jgi:hypothetical protein
MDGTRQPTTWVAAVAAIALLATGCSSAQLEETPTTGVTPITTTTPIAATTEARTTVPAPTQESPGPEIAEAPSVAVATPTTTTTTEAPASAESDGDIAAPVIIEDSDIDELDALLADLDRILGDLDQSFTQDEGDIFDE